MERLRPLGYMGGRTIVRGLLRRIFLALDFHPGAAMQVDWADFGFARTQGSSAFTRVGAVGANVTVHEDRTVTAGASYCYRVRAYNTANRSPSRVYSSARVGLLVGPAAAHPDVQLTPHALDHLDRDILAHWSRRFPRPSRVRFCAYDVDEHEMRCLCHHPRPFEVPGLMAFFASHNRFGMLGDFSVFPAFAGDLAVFVRRYPLHLEHDLSFFLLHASDAGAFADDDCAILKRWVVDILEPWHRPMGRTLGEEEHLLDLLVLLAMLEGNLHDVVEHNLVHTREDHGIPTPLVAALACFLDAEGTVDEQRVRRHFLEMGSAVSNQELPTKELAPPEALDALLESMHQVTARLVGLVPHASQTWPLLRVIAG